MKKIRFFIIYIFLFICVSFFSCVKADFSGFLDQLETMNIPVEQILEQTGVTRYELTRLLNAVECKDCINPNSFYLNRYTSYFWDDFTSVPGRDFDDIKYNQAKYNKKSYYYCVAYVGDNQYMRGYPAETSPICAGKFCGTRYTTKAEFLQVIINMMGKYLYPLFALNWKDVKNWLDDVGTDSYEGKNFTDAYIKTIKERAKDCGDQSCILQDSTELKIYLQYCTFNLEACGMVPMGKIKEGYWPVAELNILYRQYIINIDEAAKYNVDQLIDGPLLLKILAGLNNIISCSFDNDYDCDGILNAKDVCAYTYNPQLKDYDDDGIPDVCDDDIDNDGIKNPIGIVDDNGRIDISLWTGSMDNCLFTKNYEQTHTKGWIGDACLGSESLLSLTIAVQKISGTLPQTITFSALNKGPVQSLNWDFGDGYFGSGQTITHTYTEAGLYTVRLQAKGNGSNDGLAKTTVIVGKNPTEKRALSLLANTLGGAVKSSISLSLSTLGNYDTYEWDFGDGTKETSSKTSFKKVYSTGGTYSVVVKGLINGAIESIGIISLGIGENTYGSSLKAAFLNPDKNRNVSFSTDIYGFSLGNVSSIYRDFGDGTTTETNTLTSSHTYKTSGKKVVMQTINLINGSKISSIITLYVVAPRMFNSYSLQYLPSPLDANTFKRLSFSTDVMPNGLDTFSYFIHDYDDDNSDTINYSNKITFPLSKYHVYNTPGVYYPQTTITIDQCSFLSAQATLAVGGADFCIQAKLDGSLNKYSCDIDDDGIPDICDSDMDGDGYKNLLGIINPENYNDCDYIGALKDGNKDGLLNLDILYKHFQGVCSLDNAPFPYNPDQSDKNRNNIGDALEDALSGSSLDIISPEKDTDGDGLPDLEDGCPTLAENYNGVKDYDGCPEIGTDLGCENIVITPATSCLQCPCQFIDFSSALTNNDQVKAVLRDNKKRYDWSYSIGIPINY